MTAFRLNLWLFCSSFELDVVREAVDECNVCVSSCAETDQCGDDGRGTLLVCAPEAESGWQN